MKCRQLGRDEQIGVERKRSTIEHKFVLAADLIEINQRQSAFGDARHRDRQPQIALFARVGRAVRHHQDFGAGLGQAFDDVFVVRRFFEPDVFANGNADPHAADCHRTGGGAAREQALFVEHAVVRQVCLETNGGDPATLQQRACVVELAVLDPWAADQHGRPAIGGLARERFDRGAAGGLKCRFEHEVFRRVAGNEQFGQNHQIGAVGPRLRAGGARHGGVALDIANARVQLGERNRKLVGALRHEAMVP